MRHHLRVRLRGKLKAGALQFLPQQLVVFNDAVVHQGDFAAHVGVGINLTGNAVGGPAGVGNARVGAGFSLPNLLLQALHLALGAQPQNFPLLQ